MADYMKGREEKNRKAVVALEGIKPEFGEFICKIVIPKDGWDSTHLNVSMKNVGRIEIRSRVHCRDEYHITTYNKTEYGGYEYHSSKTTAPKNVYSEVTAILHGLPVVTKTKSKPKDDRNTILQNAIGRLFQEKSEHAHISILANNSDRHVCELNLKFVSLSIGKDYIRFEHPTLGGPISKRFPFQSGSPKFDPNVYVEKIIAFDNKQITLQEKLVKQISDLDCLGKVSGCH